MMGVTIPTQLIEPYPRFSLYNSPYPAHDDASGIDLYPASNAGISPVEGVVRGVRTVGCPDREYAVDHDHVIVIDIDEDWARTVDIEADGPLTARILHIDPAVEPGDRVRQGDTLGRMVRSGFFGPWVDNHVHLEVRDRDADPYRATGSRRLDVDVPVGPLSWDGTGTVVEAGSTFIRLDGPQRSNSGPDYAALGSDNGVPIDGGLAHYADGGAFRVDQAETDSDRVVFDDDRRDETLSLLGQPICTVGAHSDASGESDGCRRQHHRGYRQDRETTRYWTDVQWRDVAVYANGDRVTGLSLFVTRRSEFGIKIVWRDHGLSVGDDVTVSIRPTPSPIRLAPGRYQ